MLFRSQRFVTQKVIAAVRRIAGGNREKLGLGNLKVRRDWGWAPEYVDAMWRMMQEPEPGDFVIGTGEDHSVRDLVEIAFGHAGLDPGEHVRTDPALERPAEVERLVADYSKAERELGWLPRTSFEELVKLMVDADLELLEKAPVAPNAVTYPTAAPAAPRQETVPDVLPHERAATD